MSLLNCSTLSSGKSQPIDKAENLSEIENDSTAVDLTKCTWPKKIREDKISEYMYTFEEIMIAYKRCFLIHNSWVDKQTE